LLITTDRGLCGAFSSNIIRAFNSFSSDKNRQDIDVIAVGKKGFESIKRQGFAIPYKLINYGGKITYNDARGIGEL